MEFRVDLQPISIGGLDWTNNNTTIHDLYNSWFCWEKLWSLLTTFLTFVCADSFLLSLQVVWWKPKQASDLASVLFLLIYGNVLLAFMFYGHLSFVSHRHPPYISFALTHIGEAQTDSNKGWSLHADLPNMASFFVCTVCQDSTFVVQVVWCRYTYSLRSGVKSHHATNCA